MNVVSIMAHADDEMRCLGSLLKCKQRGDRLFLVTVTDGSKGFVQNPVISRQEARRIRQMEMQALADQVGAEYLNLGEPDEFLFPVRYPRCPYEIDRSHPLDAGRPDLYPLPRRLQLGPCDSQLVGTALRDAGLPARSADFIPAFEGVSSDYFPASHYVDISDLYLQKARLLQCHASQEAAMQAALGTGLADLCGRIETYRGEQVGCRRAECFLPMPGRGTIKPYPVLP